MDSKSIDEFHGDFKEKINNQSKSFRENSYVLIETNTLSKRYGILRDAKKIYILKHG